MVETKEFGENLIRVVGAVIFNQERTKVLMGVRSQNTSHPEKCAYPGGKIEEGESPFEAIIREIREELSLDVEPLEILHIGLGDSRNAGKPTHQIFYIECKLRSNFEEMRIDPQSHKAIKWVEIDKLTGLNLFEADLEFAKKLAVSLTSPVPSLN